MPFYDYRCTLCGHQVEVMHPIGGTGPETCEQCGGAMRKALSPPAIHFKGSGWAKKDAQAASRPKSTEKATTDGGEGKAPASGGEKGSGTSDAGGGGTASDGPAKAASGTASD